jgi:hypothetical protein
MSPNLEKAVTLLRRELHGGPVLVNVLLREALVLGLNKDFLKVAKKYLAVEAIRDRDIQNGRTLCWRWAMPKASNIQPTQVAPSITPVVRQNVIAVRPS